MLLLHVEYHSWFYDITWYILFSILSWPMISTQYPSFVLTPTFMFFFLIFVECSKRAVVLNSTVILVSLRHTGSSGWANASSLDWIFFFMSWCLEVPAWSSFLCIFSFLETLRFSNLIIDVLVMMTSRFWENNRCWILKVNGLVLFNKFKSSALFTVDITLKC